MRIISVDIPGLSKFGLKNVKMDRLGGVVVLAGKNGAGKSRLLARLSAWTQESFPLVGTRGEMENFLRIHAIPQLNLVSPIQEQLWKNEVVRDFVNRTWPNQRIDWSDYYDLETDGAGSPTFVHFVPKQINLIDPDQLSRHDLLQRATSVEQVGVIDLQNSVLARIQVIQNRWWNATHQGSTVSSEERENAVTRYDQLNQLLEHFLGERLKRSIDDQAELFGFPIGQARLSDGQIILLQFCVAIHAQAGKLSELIVLMDEPENHLHPGAVLDAITEIERSLTQGQLWIATHSVPLLAHFDADSIWWMEHGTVQHAGSQPETVLRGLVGDDERISKLSAFLGLPAELAANTFAYQCLLPPAVLNTGADDPQTRQISRLLASFHPSNQPLRVLDFGAGRGRLISTIRDEGPNPERLIACIDYLAYDRSAKYREDCEAAIARLYGRTARRYFHQEQDLRSMIAGRSGDVVVMCNVLHEIDPIYWLNLFSADGLIRYFLRPQGLLLLVEDMEMRVGEKAHERGFLVLDTADLRALFQIPESESRFVLDDARGDGRLKAHLVPVQYLENATVDTVRQTLRQVRHLAMEQIKILRRETPNYRQGRKHAFYVQQFANAELALCVIGS